MKMIKKLKNMFLFSTEKILKDFSKWLTKLAILAWTTKRSCTTMTKKKAFTMIGHVFGGKLKKHWREVLQKVGKSTENKLTGVVSKHLKQFLNDDDCHDVQVNDLKEKCKLWKFGEWLQRIETINEFLKYMDNYLPQLTEKQIKDVI